ncbi:MAG: DMT family transporter [Gammaproteobacteria bacterium]|nr:DMT family transporter [Gammaproteobacteria bacterium]
MNRQSLGILALLIGNIFIASNFVVGQYAADLIAPWQFALLRFGLGFLILLPFTWPLIKKHRQALWKHRWPLLFQGLTGIAICGGTAYEALLSTSAINAGLIFASSPIIALILACLWLKTKLSIRQLLGVIITLVGVVGIICHGKPQQLLALKFSSGDWWMVATACSYALFIILVRRYRTILPPLTTIIGALFTGTLFLLIPSTVELAFGMVPHFRNSHLWWSILYSGIFTAAIAYAFVIRGTELAGARTASILIYTIPLFATIEAFIILGDTLHLYDFLSALIMTVGIMLTLIEKRSQPAAKSATMKKSHS